MNRIILMAFVLTISTSTLFAQSGESSSTYDYISLTMDKTTPKNIFISYSDGKYEEIKVEASGDFDYSGLFKVINEKEKLGYELFSNNLSSFGGNANWTYHNFILRRRKN